MIYIPYNIHKTKYVWVTPQWRMLRTILWKKNIRLEISTFHFTKQIIQNVKERSRASTYFMWVSTWFWRCVFKSRQDPEEHLVYFVVASNVNIIFKLADARGIWRGERNWWKRSLPWWRYVLGRGKYITTCYFFSTYYSIHSTPCLTMATLYDYKHHHKSLHHLFGLDLPVVQT